MNEMRSITRHGLATYLRDTLEEPENEPKIALASKNFAPLICRVVRAARWRWALGLDSRWGTPLRSVSTPNLRSRTKPLYPRHTEAQGVRPLTPPPGLDNSGVVKAFGMPRMAWQTTATTARLPFATVKDPTTTTTTTPPTTVRLRGLPVPE